jgi:hypothetical protein
MDGMNQLAEFQRKAKAFLSVSLNLKIEVGNILLTKDCGDLGIQATLVHGDVGFWLNIGAKLRQIFGLTKS